MLNIFPEYKKISSAEIDSIRKSCIYAFDTNVILNFYRYSENTSARLEDAIKFYDNRVWIPYQAGYEFFENKLDVIDEQFKNYEEPRKYLTKLRDILNNKRGHPFISQSLLDEFNIVVSKIEQEFSKGKRKVSGYIHDDKILDKISILFDNKIGVNYTNEELEDLYEKGRKRFSLQIPPGFMDIVKPEPNRYGDFIIWNQLIDKAKSDSKPIIFVSDDEKEDWFTIHLKKPVGPLPALIKEFKNLSGQDIYIVQTFQFLEYAYDEMNKVVDDTTIQEIKNIASQAVENNSAGFFDYHKIDFAVKCKNLLDENENSLYNAMQNRGYQVSKVSSEGNIHHFTLNVPFIDLVRRFHVMLIQLLKQFDADIVYFRADEYLDS